MSPRLRRDPSSEEESSEPGQYGIIRFKLDGLITQRKLQQKRIAKASGLHPVTLSRLVYRSRQIDLDTLARLCYALNIKDMNQLLEWDPPAEYIPPQLETPK